MKTIKVFLFLFVVMTGVFSCKNMKNRWEIDTPQTEINAQNIQRYENDLFAIEMGELKEGLKNISGKYPLFLNADLNDTLNILQMYNYLTDPKIVILYEESRRRFGSLDNLTRDINRSFRYLKHYFPSDSIPKVYTYISGIRYENPVIFSDSVLLIGIDNYFGPGYITYKQLGLPYYLTLRMQPHMILTDCIKAIAHAKVNRVIKNTNTLLEEMLNRGKVLYITDMLLPWVADTAKIGYTAQNLLWCIENEANIWSFLINNELLYSSDFHATRNFLHDGPFTKGFGNDSPARIGEWLGWQIIRSYMNKNPNVTIMQLLNEDDAIKVLRDSGYKPKK